MLLGIIGFPRSWVSRSTITASIESQSPRKGFSLQRKNPLTREPSSNLCFHVLPRDQSIKSRANPASCIHEKPPRSCIDHRGTNWATRHDHRRGVVEVVGGDLQARIAFHAGHHVEQEGLQLAKACFDTIPAGDARDRSFDKLCRLFLDQFERLLGGGLLGKRRLNKPSHGGDLFWPQPRE